jgi:hypothetical protein
MFYVQKKWRTEEVSTLNMAEDDISDAETCRHEVVSYKNIIVQMELIMNKFEQHTAECCFIGQGTKGCYKGNRSTCASLHG